MILSNPQMNLWQILLSKSFTMIVPGSKVKISMVLDLKNIKERYVSWK